MTEIFKSVDGLIELRLGRWQDVLADVTGVDAVITDPPYSERTHAGQRTAGNIHERKHWSNIPYDPVTSSDMFELVQWTTQRCRRWSVVFGDHIMMRWLQDYFDDADWYTYPPVPWIKPNGIPKLNGDGPSCQVEFATMSRPRRRWEARFRPGYYVALQEQQTKIRVGCKPINLMRAVVRDYSEPGDLVVDLCSGGATTLIAAAIEGRRSIGAEMDPETFAKAVTRIKRGYTPAMVMPAAKKMKQEGLL